MPPVEAVLVSDFGMEVDSTTCSYMQGGYDAPGSMVSGKFEGAWTQRCSGEKRENDGTMTQIDCKDWKRDYRTMENIKGKQICLRKSPYTYLDMLSWREDYQGESKVCQQGELLCGQGDLAYCQKRGVSCPLTNLRVVK
jgi:hypothetical protein